MTIEGISSSGINAWGSKACEQVTKLASWGGRNITRAGEGLVSMRYVGGIAAGILTPVGIFILSGLTAWTAKHFEMEGWKKNVTNTAAAILTVAAIVFAVKTRAPLTSIF